MKTTTKVLGALAVGLFVAAGCVAPTDTGDDAVSLPQGLSVLEQTDNSISVAFREGDVVVYMQSIRSKLAPEYYLEALNMPLYEIDTRFMDANGFIFYVAQGGHAWADPSWGEDLERQMAMERPLRGSNEVLFRVATDAAKTMREDISLEIGDEAAFDLMDEVDAIVNTARSMHPQFIHQFEVRNQELVAQGRAPVQRLEHAAEEITYGTAGPEDQSWSNPTAISYSITLHADSLGGLPGYAGGDHSATQRHAWSGGSIYSRHSSCNHGTCASLMPQKANSAAKEFAANELKANHCSGEYKWDSDGGNYGHNCHDDTRIQMHNFAYKSTKGGIWRWCDGGDRDHDISVDVLFVELDQSGYPRYSTDTNRGYGAQY